ncbi:MAG: uroporphyrinogen-III synthase, partial [Terriglobia bacterium]
MQVAAEAGLAERVSSGLRRAVIASIGPISTAALQSYGIAPDFEPSHPKMGQLVFEAAEKANGLLRKKKSGVGSQESESEPRT